MIVVGAILFAEAAADQAGDAVEMSCQPELVEGEVAAVGGLVDVFDEEDVSSQVGKQAGSAEAGEHGEASGEGGAVGVAGVEWADDREFVGLDGPGLAQEAVAQGG